VWVDAVDFVLSDHVGAAGCPAPGTERALLDFAAALLVQPLPAARPPWRAPLVTGLAGRRCALVLVFHHALADGSAASQCSARSPTGSGHRRSARVLSHRPPSPGWPPTRGAAGCERCAPCHTVCASAARPWLSCDTACPEP